jgi:Bacterial RNA polymerase, alpha chain C terminal domain
MSEVEPTPELPDNTPIRDVRFPTRIQDALFAAGIKTVGEVREMADETLVGLPELGKVGRPSPRDAWPPVNRGCQATQEILDRPRADPLGPAFLLCKHAGTEVLSHAYLAFNCAP